MQRSIAITLSTALLCGDVAFAQATIEPPRRSAPQPAPAATPTPAPTANPNPFPTPSIPNPNPTPAPATTNAPANRGGVVLPGGTPRPTNPTGITPTPTNPANPTIIPSTPAETTAANAKRLADLRAAQKLREEQAAKMAEAVKKNTIKEAGSETKSKNNAASYNNSGKIPPAYTQTRFKSQEEYDAWLNEPKETVFDEEANTIDALVQIYEDLADVTVIRHPQINQPITMVVNPNRAFRTRGEALDYIKAVLIVNNLSMEPYTAKLHKLVMSGTSVPTIGNNPFIDGSPVYTDISQLPEKTDGFIKYFMKFDYIPATQAAQVLAQLLPPSGASGAGYVPFDNAKGVMIVDTIPVVRTLASIRAEIDVSAGEIINKQITLKLSTAEDVAALVTEIMTQSSQNKGAGATSAAKTLISPGQTAGQGTTIAAEGPSTAIVADPRTNKIILSGPRSEVDFIEKLIRDLDRPSEVENLASFQLRYIRVGDIINLAADALETQGFGSSSGGGTSGGGARTTGSATTPGQGGATDRLTNSRGSGSTGSNRSGVTGSTNNSFGGGFSGGGTTSGGGGRSSGSRSSSSTVSTLPETRVVGKTFLVSDPQSNSLIVSGPPESLKQIKQLIDKLDRRPLQVHIDCIVAEVTLGDDLQFGVDVLRKVDSFNLNGNTIDSAGIYKSITGGTGIIDPATLNVIGNFPQGTTASGLNTYFQINELWNAYIRTVENTNQLKIIQKPSVSTTNNTAAYIEIGREVPYPGNQQSSIVSGGTQSLNSSIDYKEVLLSLDVTPLINSKNEVTLDIKQVNDNVIGQTIINGDSIPIVGRQSAQTILTVPNGAIAVLAGFTSQSITDTNGGLPLLARIPIIKNLTGSTQKKDDRRELLIFIQPRIMETADEMVDVNSRIVQSTVIGPEAEAYANPPRDSSDVIIPTENGDVRFDDAGYDVNGAPNKKKNLVQRLGDLFKRKRAVPANGANPNGFQSVNPELERWRK